MKQEEFVKGLTYLGMAYGKEYNQMETKQIYEFVKEYNYETFVKAINSIIRSSKFVPKIAYLIEACEENKSSQRIEVVKYMKDIGYFKYSPYGEITDEHASRNYQKALMFLERNNVPDWLQDDINYFYNKMKQERLTGTTNNLLN
jgi:hypothetical protein